MSKHRIELLSNVNEEGYLQMNVRQSIKTGLLNFKKKKVSIIIDSVSNTRSGRENRYYWGGVIPEQIKCFKERLGEIWDKDEMHDWNKSNVWHSLVLNEATGEMIRKPGSSRKQTKIEFEHRLEKLRQDFERDWEWRIPLPNEQLEIE